MTSSTSSVAADLTLRPRFERVLSMAVTVLGSWTIAVQISVLAGWSLPVALGLFLALAALAFATLRRLRAGLGPAPDTTPLESSRPKELVAPLLGVILLGGTALLTIDTHPKPLWFLMFTVALLAFGVTLQSAFRPRRQVAPSPPDTEGSPPLWQTDLWMLAIAVGTAVICSLITRPNADDSFYSSLAVQTATHPFVALQSIDTLHGLGQGALLSDSYRLHSFEALAGALSWITGIEAVVFLQAVFPPLGAVLLVLAAGRLARLVDPRATVALTLVFSILCFFFYDSSGFLRLQQGKHLLFMLMPLLLFAQTADHARSGRFADLLLLFLGFTTCMGLSGTALFTAPPAVASVIVASVILAWGEFGPRVAMIRGGAQACVTGAYYAVIALLFMATAVDFPGSSTSWHPALKPNFEILYRYADEWVKGENWRTTVFAMTVLPPLLAWTAARTRVGLVILGAASVMTVLVVHNPSTTALFLSAEPIAAVHTRLQHILPIIFSLAVLVVAPFLAMPGWRRWVAVTPIMAMGLAVLSTGPMIYEEGFALKWPWQTKAPWETTMPDALDNARCLVALTGPDRVTLAPHRRGIWIPQVPGHPVLVLNRLNNAQQIDRIVGKEDASWRFAMIAWVGDDPDRQQEAPYDANRFALGLERYAVGAIITNQDNPLHETLLPSMTKAGFVLDGTCGNDEVWLRP